MAGLFGAPRRLPQVDPGLGTMLRQEQDEYEGVRFPGAPTQPQTQTKPYWETTAGKLALAGQIIGQHGRGGANPMLQIAVQQQQERARQQQAMQQRQWGNEDWLTRQQWERANPTPRVNDTEQDYNFWQQNLTPEQFNTWKQNRIDPPQYRQGPDGQFYRIETPRAPTAPVGRLTPIEPMAAPAGGGGGNFMTPAQFQAIAAQKGRAWAENWARQNNIQVRN